MIRVLIADDEPMIRAGVRAVLATAADIDVVAEAADGHDAVELVRRHRPAVAVLDIRMPGLNGIDAAAEIRTAVPGTGVIMLTTFGEDDYILQALGGGAAGFLIKSGEPEELLTGVRAVAGEPPTCHRGSRPGSSRTSPPREPAPWPVGVPLPVTGSRPSPPGNERYSPFSAPVCPTVRSPGDCM